MKILVLKFNALGDVIRTSYILPGLYDKYTDLVVDWITSDSAVELLRFNPYIRFLSTPGIGLSFLKTNDYDLVLSLDDEDEVLSILNDVKYKDIIGAYFSEGGKKYDDRSSEWFDMGLLSRFGKNVADQMKKENIREHNEIFADMLGISIEKGLFFNSSFIEERFKSRFDGDCFNIGINPSAGNRWRNKELPFDEVCQLIRELSSRTVDGKKIKIHLLGGAAEQDRNASIENHLSGLEIINWGGGNTLLEFAAIIKACDYLISGDTLALHFAISQQVRNLSYYAPTSAAEIGTFGTGSKITSLADDYCSYRSDADNSSITAERILEKLVQHCPLEN